MTEPKVRGYTILVVMVVAVALGAVAGALLLVGARDTIERRQQMNVTKALYAAEGGVAKGVDDVTALLAHDPAPDLGAAALAPPAMAGVKFDELAVRYVNAMTLLPSSTPMTTNQVISSGGYRGLRADRTPIEVLARTNVGGAHAILSDFVSLDRIPVFQFSLFTDGPLEMLSPVTTTWSGRIHSNSGIYFGDGASKLTFTNASLSTAGRVWLRAVGGASSQTSGRAPLVNGVTLACDDASSGAAACPSGKSWLTWSTTTLPAVRDAAHQMAAIDLPTGAVPPQRVQSVPDLCGEDAHGNVVPGAGLGMPVSPNRQVIELPNDGDGAELHRVKLAWLAGARVIDGVWARQLSPGTFVRWFSQDDPSSAEAQCVYYGYDPTSDAGGARPDGDGVPAVRDIRFWDHQDRRMRRVVAIDVQRLTRCLPWLETSAFNGVLYVGESVDATRDNWGLDVDARFYEAPGGVCDARFLKLPHYLRGQISSAPGVGSAPDDMPDYLRNDDVAGLSLPVLDNPYYPSTSYCTPAPGRPKGLGDGPYRLPQGDGDGVVEPGKNELVESGVLLRNARRLPNVLVNGSARGFTLATNTPLYVQGDYNTAAGTFSPDGSGYTSGKVPAALLADAVTFLSEKYNDLQENPFAPVGPLAVWRAVRTGDGDVDGSVVDEQQATSSNARRWTLLRMAQPAGTAPSSGAKRFDAALSSSPSGAFEPASPAPCVNLLREAALRRRLSNGGGTLPSSRYEGGGRCGGLGADNCGLDGLTRIQTGAGALVWGGGRDWLEDMSSFPQPLKDRAGGGTPDALFDAALGDVAGWQRSLNAFVAFAPLERFLDVSLYAVVDSSSPSFSNRTSLPSGRDAREALRDWMRCTLNSQHALSEDGTLAGISYGGVAAPAVIMGVEPQPFSSGSPEYGMTAAGSSSIDVTYRNILGNDGFAPMSGDAVFRTSDGRALFTRDRSSLVDPNGTASPSSILPDLSTLASAAAGDQVAVNASILTGSSWRCPSPAPYPSASSSYALNDSMTSTGGPVAGDNGWGLTARDDGVDGIFRFQESFWQLPRTGSSRAVDLFVNGSVVAMFTSVVAPGRHLPSQGRLTAAVQGCPSGDDDAQAASRSCRVSPGFEYAWDAPHRVTQYDVDNDTAVGLPPGTPRVFDTTRIRWVRR